uniref:Sushi, von Willebrand factor type A, EGF and pentraxin domain-containing protein 1-like n=1 Tax=Phallusia mammillata TaxID=59560 RepID=A0A6F9DUQ0_9ASCI|nr:sushi, von Willebrand factor type A, EGF and pentraxin domain-containing protein 1-like [Phallusia mammillata]
MDGPAPDGDANTLKRSNRQKKKKKFFDDDASESVKPVLKVKLKAMKPKEKQINVVDTEEEKPPTPENVEEPVDDLVDDEEKWLQALEKGELDDNGDLPKAKDPLLMTARQRAKMDRIGAPSLIDEIPATPKEELSEEAKKKRDEKNKRRKLQAVKRAEENKKQTIERLVQSNKLNKDQSKGSGGKHSGIAMIKYTNTAEAAAMSFPEGFDYPLKAKRISAPPPTRTCAICGERRKYDCAKSGVALCSLACYKMNSSKVAPKNSMVVVE